MRTLGFGSRGEGTLVCLTVEQARRVDLLLVLGLP
jgi:hypothetical protein